MKKIIIAMLIAFVSTVVMARPHCGPGPGFHRGGFRPAPFHHGGWHGAVRTHHGWIGAPAHGNLYHHRGYYGGYYGGHCAPIIAPAPVVVSSPVVVAPTYTAPIVASPVVTTPVVTPTPTVVYPSTTTVISGPAAGVGVQVGPVSVGAGVRLW